MVVVVVVGGRKGFPQEVLGSHVTASDLERLMSEYNSEPPGQLALAFTSSN